MFKVSVRIFLSARWYKTVIVWSMRQWSSSGQAGEVPGTSSGVIEKSKSSRGQNHVHRKQHPLNELNSPIQLGFMSYIRHSGIKDLNV